MVICCPLQIKYPNLTPYAAFNDNPLYFKDPNGKNGIAAISGGDGTSKKDPIIVTITANYYYTAATDQQKSAMQDVKTELAEPQNFKNSDGKYYRVIVNVSFIQSDDPNKSANDDRGVSTTPSHQYGNTVSFTTSDSKQPRNYTAPDGALGYAADKDVVILTDRITDQVDLYNSPTIDNDQAANTILRNVLKEEILHNLGGLHQDAGAIPGEAVAPAQINPQQPSNTSYTENNAKALLNRIG